MAGHTAGDPLQCYGVMYLYNQLIITSFRTYLLLVDDGHMKLSFMRCPYLSGSRPNVS